jgi:hypothetical protein
VARALILLILSACAAAPRPPEVASAVAGTDRDRLLPGTWAILDGSSTIMKITAEGDRISVDAWSTDENVRYTISDVSWDGETLKVEMTYPKTGFQSRSELVLADPNTLEGKGTGAGYQVHEVWRRVAQGMVPGPGPDKP